MQALLVDIMEAERRLEELIAAAGAGHEVFITRDGRPVVRIEPIGPPASTGGIGQQVDG